MWEIQNCAVEDDLEYWDDRIRGLNVPYCMSCSPEFMESTSGALCGK